MIQLHSRPYYFIFIHHIINFKSFNKKTETIFWCTCSSQSTTHVHHKALPICKTFQAKNNFCEKHFNILNTHRQWLLWYSLILWHLCVFLFNVERDKLAFDVVNLLDTLSKFRAMNILNIHIDFSLKCCNRSQKCGEICR